MLILSTFSYNNARNFIKIFISDHMIGLNYMADHMIGLHHIEVVNLYYIIVI